MAYIDNYVERNDVPTPIAYVGDHYELNTSTAIATSYYTFAGGGSPCGTCATNSEAICDCGRKPITASCGCGSSQRVTITSACDHG